nr:NAD(P)/FAD-dependent oxidoreductase [Saprospiraceae bacterium]
MGSKIAVIGSGISGIAVAARLAARGHEVVVFEKNSFPGGKLSEIRAGEFRFDAGPSLFTMPQWVDDVFVSCSESPRDFFNYKPLPVLCKYFWNNGKKLEFSADLDTAAKRLEEDFGEDRGALSKYLKKSRKKYDLVGEIFLKKPLNQWSTWWDQKTIKSLFQIFEFELFSTLNAANKRFFNSGEIVQLFNRYATYNGSNPYRISGMFSMIPHIEMNRGAYAPEGGMIAITNSLVELGKRCGVEYQFGTLVSEILVKDSRVTGIRLKDGGEMYFDRIISNMDIKLTYEKLLPDCPPPAKLKYEERSSSGFIFYWGIKREFPELDVHNIFFSENYPAEFNAIEKGEIADDLTVYVNITSKYNPTDAPRGMENWFVMVNVPGDRGHDWVKMRAKIRKRVIRKLNKNLGLDIESQIVSEEVMDPTGLARRTLSADGALYGSSSNNMWAAFLRQFNRHSGIKNLYFCGGSVHPGGGIPLCLSSAEIVDKMIGEETF